MLVFRWTLRVDERLDLAPGGLLARGKIVQVRRPRRGLFPSAARLLLRLSLRLLAASDLFAFLGCGDQLLRGTNTRGEVRLQTAG